MNRSDLGKLPFTGKLKKILLPALFYILICHLFSGCDSNSPSGGPKIIPEKEYPAFARLSENPGNINAIDLNGTWRFKATDETVWMDGIVPGTVQQDLLRAGRIKDPFYRDNELDAQWIEKKVWEYERTFTVDDEFLLNDRIVLDCLGLDVICDLYLNNEQIASTRNMFIEYEFDVKKYLHPGTNTLRAVFRSVLEWNKLLADADPRVTWNTGQLSTGDALKGLLFYSRKEASDFGWDWGVRLLSCGIWKPLRLSGYRTARIKDLEVRQDLSNPDEALLSVSADIENYTSSELSVNFTVSREEKTISETRSTVINNVSDGRLTIKDPQLWWPNGWGDHPLYTVTAELKDGDHIVHSKTLRIGLRTIELSQEKDERGQTFGVKVNGHLIFCKGANWIPSDALPNRLTEKKYTGLLGSCIEANMNMIRLWGGGLYESEIFYEFCDENGLMIWHDFMFASGPYLAVDSYVENVSEEIRNVVLRLRHHPSIILWCGNNESEYNMAAGQNWLKNYPGTSWADYDKIFYKTIPETAALYDPGRPYYPSSPHNPLDREKKNPGWETASGTAHTYEVWGGERRFDAYSEMGKYRFVAEFGFQSLPHIETIKAFTAPEDRYFPSAILDHHNLAGRKPNQNQGNVRIITNAVDMFHAPEGMANWVTVSQILQGEGMKMGCEALRRNYPASTGALYWQLNDNWPVISWSSIDYFGRWKALQYMAKRFFSPILVTGVADTGIVNIYGTNDLLIEKRCTLEWELLKFGGSVLSKGKSEIKLPANQSLLIETIDLQDFINEDPGISTYRKESYRKRSDLVLSLKLAAGDTILSSNIVTFVPPKYWQLEDPQIRYSISVEKDITKITLTASEFAAYVELGIGEGYARFSDNYFHLLPGEKKTVTVVSSDMNVIDFRKRFFARSLIDTYKSR